MTSFLRLLSCFALPALTSFVLLHCSSAKTAGPESGPDFATPETSTREAGAPDAPSVSSPDAESPPDADAQDAADSAIDAAPACNVRTSGTSDAILSPGFTPFTWTLPGNGYFIGGLKIALGPADDTYLALSAVVPAASSDGGPATKQFAVLVMHVLSTGALDTSFGDGGMVTLPDWTEVYAIIIDHHGQVVVTGRPPALFDQTYSFALTALRPDGATAFTVDQIGSADGFNPCMGCIVDDPNGYLFFGPGHISILASDGSTSAGDPYPSTAGGCSLAKRDAFVSIVCDRQSGISRFDLQGKLVTSFGAGGHMNTDWRPRFDPWPAADGSLYVSELTQLAHVLNNGSFDPAFPSATTAPYGLVATQPIVFGAARCDGTQMFVERSPTSVISMQSITASNATLTDAGSFPLPSPDGSPPVVAAFAMDESSGALYVAYEAGAEIRLVSVLTAK